MNPALTENVATCRVNVVSFSRFLNAPITAILVKAEGIGTTMKRRADI
jgi:hypothetical protein